MNFTSWIIHNMTANSKSYFPFSFHKQYSNQSYVLAFFVRCQPDTSIWHHYTSFSVAKNHGIDRLTEWTQSDSTKCSLKLTLNNFFLSVQKNDNWKRLCIIGDSYRHQGIITSFLLCFPHTCKQIKQLSFLHFIRELTCLLPESIGIRLRQRLPGFLLNCHFVNKSTEKT